ncbi:MAG: ATP-dependent Zn protease [Leptolyngbya sp. SIO4C1]|nr:ATP-dependent Zn protease [Leptolyngbya sp. SIO4C1]
MNQITLNLIAISVFSVTMLALVGPLVHISPEALAIATAGGFGLVAIDRFGWEGRGGNLLIDWLSQSDADYRQRILHHEAGHFLVAYLLGVPIEAYTLTAWEAWRSGLPGSGGVIFNADEIEAEVAQGKLSAQQLDRYCKVWMAGIAAEQTVYGKAQGGSDDRLKLQVLWQQLDRPAAEAPLKQRWATLQAKTLIETEADAYQALVAAMSERMPVTACCQLIEQHRTAAA